VLRFLVLQWALLFVLPSIAQAQAMNHDHGSQPSATPRSAWVKLCKKSTAGGKEQNDCLTHHERIDGNSGRVVLSAALRQIEGQDRRDFVVIVPLGVRIQSGLRVTVFPKQLWAKVEKSERVEKADETKLKVLQLQFTHCEAAGCSAEMEATVELLKDLEGGGGLTLLAISKGGKPLAFPIPLHGFAQALAGQPVDPLKYDEARTKLMDQIKAKNAKALPTK
jgi:invasion protein IalB